MSTSTCLIISNTPSFRYTLASHGEVYKESKAYRLSNALQNKVSRRDRQGDIRQQGEATSSEKRRNSTSGEENKGIRRGKLKPQERRHTSRRSKEKLG